MAPLVGLLVKTALDSTSTFGTRYGPQEWHAARSRHLRAGARVASGIAHDARAHRQQMALGVGADRVVQRHRMALHVMLRRLLAREHRLHRPPQQERRQRRLRLNGQLFLGAERSAARRQRDLHIVERQIQNSAICC